MANKKIKELTAGTTKLLATDKLPVHKDSTDSTEYKTGTQIFEGMLDPSVSANQTLFNAMLNNSNAQTAFNTMVTNDTGKTYKREQIGIVAAGTIVFTVGYFSNFALATKIVEVNFKLHVVSDNGEVIETRTYIASFIQTSDGSMDAIITQIGAAHLVNGGTRITSVTAVITFVPSTHYNLTIDIVTTDGVTADFIGDIISISY